MCVFAALGGCTPAAESAEDAAVGVADDASFRRDAGGDPSGDSGRDPADAGRELVDSGRDPVDAGRDPVDSGRDPVDSGRDPVDSGRDPVDAGPVLADAGPDIRGACPETFVCPVPTRAYTCDDDHRTSPCTERSTYVRNADGTGTCELFFEKPWGAIHCWPERGLVAALPTLSYSVDSAGPSACVAGAVEISTPGFLTSCSFPDAVAMPAGATFVRQSCGPELIAHSNTGFLRYTFACDGRPPLLVCETPPSSCYAPHGRDVGGRCEYSRFADGSACDDHDPSTAADRCYAGSCLGTALPPLATSPGTWRTSTADGAPSARNDYGVVWTGSEMILWGGDAETALNDGARFDPRTDRWRAMSTTGAPVGRSLMAAVWTGSEMIVWGGSGISEDVNDGGRYAPATDTWTPLPTLGAPSRRHSPWAVWTGSEMIVWGGYDRVLSSPRIDGARFDPVTNTWSPLPTTNAPRGGGLGAVWTGSEMFVFDPDGSARFDPRTNTWTAVPSSGLVGYQYAQVLWTGSEVLVIELRGDVAQGGARFDPATNRWTRLPPLSIEAVLAPAVWTGRAALVVGARSLVWSAADDRWFSIAPMPSRYDGHSTMIWTGTEAILRHGGWLAQTDIFTP